MTPEQMQQKSAEKVKQIMDLMNLLQVRVEARERMDKGGFIERMVFWIDEEKYAPAEPPIVKEDPQAAPAEPTNV